MSETHQRTLRTILTGTAGWLALKNHQLAYEVVNPNFCQFLGKGPEEIVGRTDQDLFTPQESQAGLAEDQAVLKNGIPRHAEQPFTGKDGVAWFSTHRAPILDDNGDPAGIIMTAHDITAFRQREEKVAQAEATQAAMEAEASNKIAEAETRAANAEAEGARQLAEAEARLTAVEEASAQRMADAQAAVEAAKSSAHALHEQQTQLTEQLRLAEEARTAAEQKVQLLESQQAAQHAAFAEAQEQRAQLESQVAEGQAAVAQARQLEAQVATLEAEKAALTGRLSQVEAAAAALQEALRG